MDKNEEKKYSEVDNSYTLQSSDSRPISEKKIFDRLFELAAKAVVMRENNEVLLLRRSKQNASFPGKWDMPGGKLENGESIFSGLEREVKEEVGILVEIGPIIYGFNFTKKYILDMKKEFSVFGKGFRLLTIYKEGEVKLSDEHDTYEWINIEKAIEKLEDTGFEKTIRDALINSKKYLENQNALDSWKRCQADFENYKKDQMKYLEEFRKYAKMDVIEQILPVVDNFEASLAHVPEKSKENKWVEGIVYIKKQLEDILKNNDIEEIEVKAGDKFNPEIHEAVGGDGKKQKITKIIQKGYKLNGRIVRAAKVEVS